MRLQEDLERKVLENQALHAQVERLKAAIEATQRGMDDWESRSSELEQRLRSLELHKNRVSSRDDTGQLKVNAMVLRMLL